MTQTATRSLAIVGRPNVGKSTLFNRLVGRRLALVDDRPGVTRDRREGPGSLYGLDFRVIDTAGYEDEAVETLPGRMRAQTIAAVAEATVAAFVIDARAGLTPLDEEIARWLRTTDTPIVVLANKAEGRAGEQGVLDAWALGLGEPIPVSAEHGEGMADLHDAIRAPLEAIEEVEPDEDLFDLNRPLRLAIVGRPNAGKSTLINRMVGSERMITGPEAGITRDSITVDWEWRGRPVVLVDTAGMRKRARVDEKLEKLSVADALRAIDHAEVVALLLDSTRGLEVQDLKIASRVVDEGRALVIGLNKWDVAEGGAALYQGVRAALNEGLAQLKGVPLLTLSGATGKGVDQIVQAAFDAREAWERRVPTGELNRWFAAALEANPPPAPGGQRIKLRYITQAGVRPPTFVLFGTRTDQLPESYRRYLLNGIRAELGFGSVPVRLHTRSPVNPFDRAKA